MDTTLFIDSYFNDLMLKLSLEKNKKVYIAGDFNFDLLKISNHDDTSNFYDKISSNLMLRLISIPTKINNKDNTVIDNIFTNQFSPDTISGNLTVTVRLLLMARVFLSLTEYSVFVYIAKIFRKKNHLSQVI